jgi:O-antigen/teichoic acid export membrane protein
MGLHIVTFIALGIAATGLMRRRWPEGLAEAKPDYEVRPWLAMALPSIFIAGMGVLQNSIDRVMIGSLLNTDLSGIYNAATRTATLVAFGLQAVNAMLAPMVSGMHSTGDTRQLQRVLRMAAWGLFSYTALGSVALIAFGPWVLALFGEEFAAGYAPLVIMVLAQTVNATCGSVGLLLQMTGHQRKVATVLAVTAVLNVALNVVLIPRFGMNGAAAATGITMVVWNLTMLVIVKRVLNLNPTIFRIPGWLKR